MNEFMDEVINVLSEACGIPAEDLFIDFTCFCNAVDCLKILGLTEDEALDYVAEHWKFNF